MSKCERCKKEIKGSFIYQVSGLLGIYCAKCAVILSKSTKMPIHEISNNPYYIE